MSWFYRFLIFLIIAAAFSLVLWWRRRRRPPAEILPRAEAELGAAGAWLKNHPEIGLPKYLEFEGEKVHYLQTGRGPNLVLLHGIGASIFTWRFLIPTLSAHYRVTALDLPGFGRSHKDLRADYGLDAQTQRVCRFLDQLKIRRAFLVGSSMGGAISLWMAHEDPERFPKVAALAAATSSELIPKRLAKLAALAPFAHKTLNRKTMRLILSNVVAKKELINSESIEAYLEPFLDQGLSLRTFFGALQLLGDRRMPKCFENMKSKVLLIQGERDRMVTLKSFRRLAKVIRHAEFATSPSGGHHIMEDEPEWTLAELLRFFAAK